MFSLFLRPEDTSPSTSCLTPHMKHNHATLQTLHQQEPCRQEQHSLFKTKLILSIVSNHLYKCPNAYKTARPHPFDTKKVEVDFSKKSIFMDFRGKKK